MNDSSTNALAALARIVGDAHVLADPALIASHLEEPRGLYRGKALALVRPADTREVAAVVAFCHAAGIPLTPQGGNTGLVGGQTPDDSGREIILSLRRLNRIREIDALADAMIVEAGVTLAEAQAAAQSADRLFPLSLASEGSCTIGGNLATNAGGVAVLAYGNARDLTTGVEVVLADGRVVHALSKLRKDNTGYDLKNLFIGSEGTLGVITAAALKLFPRPRSRATAFVGLADPHRALTLLQMARAEIGQGLTSFELMPRIGLEFSLSYRPTLRDPLAGRHAWYVLIEASSQTEAGLDDAMTELLGAALEQEIIEDASLAASLDQSQAFWAIREDLSDAQKPQGGSIKHDVSVPVGAVPAFIDEATAAVEAFLPGARVVAFGHLGDGNIHFNVSQPIGADKQAFLDQWSAMNEVVHAIVARYAGSISAEHGIGRLKRDLLAETKDPVALDVMRKLKATLDPSGILNPGKML
ncbi:MAG: FAD-binding oxidoreductase [Hyphomicrobiales bacterium]|nr:FAD-binding oxidoreductase [Hyphomicrobiales bacterium]